MEKRFLTIEETLELYLIRFDALSVALRQALADTDYTSIIWTEEILREVQSTVGLVRDLKRVAVREQ